MLLRRTKQSNTPAHPSYVISCLLLMVSCQSKFSDNTQTTLKQNPTFEDVAPIIFKNCTPCHRAGESGPFELMTYADVKKNANKMPMLRFLLKYSITSICLF